VNGLYSVWVWLLLDQHHLHSCLMATGSECLESHGKHCYFLTCPAPPCPLPLPPCSHGGGHCCGTGGSMQGIAYVMPQYVQDSLLPLTPKACTRVSFHN